MGTRANDIASLIRTGTQLDSDVIGAGAITAEKLNAGLVDLSDTNMTGISNGELLKYDSATAKYVPTGLTENSSGTLESAGQLHIHRAGTKPSIGNATAMFSNTTGGASRLSLLATNTPGSEAPSDLCFSDEADLDVGLIRYHHADDSMQFRTNASERMRINSAGEVLIGYTGDNGNYKLQVNSQIFATSSTIATSDQRYKENVIPLTDAIDTVKALNPVQFDWKEHPVHEFDRSAPTTGFIAQEVQTALADKPWLNSLIKSNDVVIEPKQTDENGNVIAEAVTEEFLGIAEGNLIAVLTKAIQEQQTQIEAQQATIEALEARLTALEGGA